MIDLHACIPASSFDGGGELVHRTLIGAGSRDLIGAGCVDRSGSAVDVRRHRSPFWSCLLVVRGTGTYSDDLGHRCAVRPGCLMHRFPDRSHDLLLDPQSGFRSLFLVGGESVLRMLEGLDLVQRDQPVVAVSPDRSWMSSAHGLISRIRDIEPDGLPVLAAEIGLVLAQLLGSVAGDERDFRTRACRELTRDPTARESLHEVAARMGMTQDAFRNRFRTLTGISPGQYRIRHRIDRALGLLKSGRYLVSEVADLLGYPSAFAFSAQFSKMTGHPPSMWRQYQEETPPQP